MRAFFSWSGELSKAVANAFYNWLPSVLQNVKPYLSAEDIDKGEKWMNNISSNLEETSIGIVFVTKENVTSPWINYETGALSNSLKASNVCPVLIDLNKGEIDSRNPLFHYQATSVNEKEDILKLLKTINNQQKEFAISDDALKKVFEWGWPTLESELKEILKAVESKITQPSTKEDEIDYKAMEEILALLRSIKKEQQVNSDNSRRYRQTVIQNQELLVKNDALLNKIRALEEENLHLKEQNKGMQNEYLLMRELQNSINKNMAAQK